MNLSPENTYLIFGIILVLYASWKTRQAQTKIRYDLQREDNSSIHGWVSWSQQKVILKTGRNTSGWFYVETDRVINEVLNEGFPFWFFPTRVAKLYYRYNSDRPLDPKTFTNSWPSPNDRAMLDIRDDVQSLNEGTRRSLGSGKKGLLDQYLPYIVLLGFAIIGYFVYNLQNQQNMLGAGMNAVEGMLGQLLKK